MASVTFLDMPGGFKMPSVGLGTWQATDEAQLESALNAALEAGYRHIDTAYAYRNEHVIGRVLEKWFSTGRLKREDVFVVTKLPAEAIHPDRVESFLKKSLENLRLEYVDLYLIHFALAIVATTDASGNRKMALEDNDQVAVWKKMEEQVDAGRAKTIGLSNFTEAQIARILKSSRIQPACLQIEVHIYLPQRKLVQFCQDNNIVVVAYSPLGSPGTEQNLSKMFNRAPRDLQNLLEDPTIKKIAQKYNKSNAQVALKYLIQRNIAIIPKSVTPQRLKDNINIFDFVLDDNDMETLYKLEVGEKARVCDWGFIPGAEKHPEWPFGK